MKKKIYIATLLVILSTTTAKAQLTDVFQAAFKSIAGFNAWVAYPQYTSSSNISGKSQTMVLAYSVKFAPIQFGSKLICTITLNVTYKKLSGDMYEIDYDTIKTCNSKSDTTHFQTIAVLAPGSIVPAEVKPVTYSQVAGGSANLSINLGYQTTTNFDYEERSGFAASFPISGLFLDAIVPIPVSLWGWKDLGFSFGAGASFPSLTNVMAHYTPADDTARVLLFSSAVAFSPNLLVGIAYQPNWLSGFHIFLDGVYKWQGFTGITYTDLVTGKAPSTEYLSRLPTTINADNWRIKLGFSIDVAS